VCGGSPILPNSTNVTERCSGVVTEAVILYINRNIHSPARLGSIPKPPFTSMTSFGKLVFALGKHSVSDQHSVTFGGVGKNSWSGVQVPMSTFPKTHLVARESVHPNSGIPSA
jgi:hypothetical protein